MIDDTLILQLFRCIVPCKKARIIKVTSGTIADIYHIEAGDKEYCFKVRSRNELLKYSQQHLQEPLAYEALRQGHVESIQQLHLRSSGEVISPVSWLPDIVYFQNQCDLLQVPWMITPWIPGGPLWKCPRTEWYQEAGAMLSRLHAVTSSINAYDLAGSSSLLATDWFTFIASEVRAKSKLLGLSFSVCESIEEMLQDLRENLSATTLVHNDFTGNNLLVDHQGGLVLIDWDNAGLCLPELDFVKMYYWRAIDEGGHLSHHHDFFDAFKKGYDRPWSRASFDLCRLLWLLRIIAFEENRERQHRKQSSLECRHTPFPRSHYYHPLLLTLLSSYKNSIL